VPVWASGEEDVGKARDGDLLTAWTCTPGAKPCAIGLVFAETVRIKLIRLFPGSGGSEEEFLAHARIGQVAVHTDEGRFEIELEPGRSHRHILVPEGVVTRGLAIEVVSTFPGSKDSMVVVPDIEVFADSGPRRPPLDLDPRRAIVSFEARRWTTEWEKNAITGETNPHILASASWIEMVDAKEGRRRILYGTGLVGEPGGRFLLVEQVARASCSPSYPFGATGSFVLVDRQTRLMSDVGSLGGVMGLVWSEPGVGFATQTTDMAGRPVTGGVLLDAEGWEIVADQGQSFSGPGDLATWGFKTRGSPCCDQGRPAAHHERCTRADPERVQALLPDRAHGQGKGEWTMCSPAPGISLLIHTPAPCEAAPGLLALVAQKAIQTIPGSGFLIGEPLPGTILVQVETEGGDDSALYGLGKSGTLEVVHEHASFFLGRPAVCRCVGSQGT
jgi:hypothetical protein